MRPDTAEGHGSRILLLTDLGFEGFGFQPALSLHHYRQVAAQMHPGPTSGLQFPALREPALREPAARDARPAERAPEGSRDGVVYVQVMQVGARHPCPALR